MISMLTYALKIRLKNEQIFFGPGLVTLMLLVNQSHSLNVAAQTMGMAYSKAWRIIKKAEKELGYALLNRKVGGADGGGSEITSEGHRLIVQYQAFQEALEEEAKRLFAQCFEGKM